MPIRIVRLTAWTVVFLAAAFASSLGLAAESKRVMILHSFGRDFKPWSEYARVIRSQLDLQSPWPLDVYQHSLITARFSDESSETPFIDYLRDLYGKQPLDLIVSIGAPAAGFIQRHRRQLFPATPMLLTAVEQRRVQSSLLAANDAVVAVSVDFGSLVEDVLRLLPDTKHVEVVVGNSPIEKYWSEQVRNDWRRFEKNVSFTWYNDLPFEDMLKRAAALPPQSVIFFLLLAVDTAGVLHEEGRALTRLHAVANAPIFSYNGAFFGQEIVGGRLLEVPEVGRQAAAVAVRILGGEKASDIRTPAIGVGIPKFDWREMQRWGISERKLPPGSVVHFRPLSMWDQYRWQMMTILAIVMTQALLITGLLFERRRRQLAEQESRRRLTEVALMNRSAAAGAMSATIAHELNQPLGTILSNAEAAELLLAANPLDMVQLREILADIRQADQRAGEIIKRMRVLLKRTDIERKEVSLGEAIQSVLHILDAEAKRRGIAMNSDQVDRGLCVRADMVHLEQVLLNLALNGMDAMTSAAPGTRKIELQTAKVGDSEVEISVADSGAGIAKDKLDSIFEPFFTTKQQGLGLGLSIVRTIIESYGGRIWAENRAGGGAVFRFTLPLVKTQPA